MSLSSRAAGGRRRGQRGLTLVELMVVLAVVGIVATLAIPNIGALMERMGARALRTEMLGMFKQARYEAINAGSQVVICPLDSSDECSNDWGGDQIVAFIDLDGDRIKDARPSSPTAPWERQLGVIDNRRSEDLKHNFASRKFFAFDGRGMAAGGSFGSLIYCSSEPDHRFSIVVARTGRVRYGIGISSC